MEKKMEGIKNEKESMLRCPIPKRQRDAFNGTHQHDAPAATWDVTAVVQTRQRWRLESTYSENSNGYLFAHSCSCETARKLHAWRYRRCTTVPWFVSTSHHTHPPCLRSSCWRLHWHDSRTSNSTYEQVKQSSGVIMRKQTASCSNNRKLYSIRELHRWRMQGKASIRASLMDSKE